MERRQILRGIGSGGLLVLAGCSGGNGDGGDGNATPTAGGADGEPTTTPPAGGDGTDGGGQATTPPDGADGGPTTPGDTEPTPTTTTGNESVSTTAQGSPSLPTLGEVSAVETNHRFSMEISNFMDQGGQATTEGRFTGSDFALTVTSQGQSYQVYQVDGTAYFVAGGQCLSGMGSGGANFDAEEWSSQHDYPSHLGALAELRPTGTTTIDGETMYVYEGDPGVARMGTVTYYVSAETGYVRRVESERVTAEFWDWGAVDEAVQAPC